MRSLLIVLIVLSLAGCKAQTIYNLGTPYETISGTNYYIKDLDNKYDAIVGTWKWEEGNSSFEITLQEFEQYSYPSTSTQYRDDIFGKYKYIKNGVVIAEVSEIAVLPNFVLSMHYRSPVKYEVVIDDVVSEKSKVGEFILTSPTTATLKLWNSGGLRINYGNGLTFALPNSSVLTKQ